MVTHNVRTGDCRCEYTKRNKGVRCMKYARIRNFALRNVADPAEEVVVCLSLWL